MSFKLKLLPKEPIDRYEFAVYHVVIPYKVEEVRYIYHVDTPFEELAGVPEGCRGDRLTDTWQVLRDNVFAGRVSYAHPPGDGWKMLVERPAEIWSSSFETRKEAEQVAAWQILQRLIEIDVERSDLQILLFKYVPEA